MKKIVIGFTMLAFLLGTAICFAEYGIPNLVGTWTVQSEGGVILKSAAHGAKTHHRGEFSTIKAEWIVTKQQGRVLHGIFKSPRATEKFVAVIAMDNKSLYQADEDGFLEGQISNDKINIIYRHSTATDSVVAVGTMTRKK
ncbi:MAG: hypothetical protein CVU55_03720 [Deltaproteobacteria bacterium HGW-Deltaproteobacteria-13]|jgi:hypothetical protein|nr:MAG: hypothetical protein CVU55_03720 [Deltaproteobacteria bacterium HGW-Deltaproteobacteria-13]